MCALQKLFGRLSMATPESTQSCSGSIRSLRFQHCAPSAAPRLLGRSAPSAERYCTSPVATDGCRCSFGRRSCTSPAVSRLVVSDCASPGSAGRTDNRSRRAMDMDAKRTLIAKIEGLPPEQRKRVEGYVDALLEGRRTDSGRETGRIGAGKKAVIPSAVNQCASFRLSTMPGNLLILPPRCDEVERASPRAARRWNGFPNDVHDAGLNFAVRRWYSERTDACQSLAVPSRDCTRRICDRRRCGRPRGPADHWGRSG